MRYAQYWVSAGKQSPDILPPVAAKSFVDVDEVGNILPEDEAFHKVLISDPGDEESLFDGIVEGEDEMFSVML